MLAIFGHPPEFAQIPWRFANAHAAKHHFQVLARELFEYFHHALTRSDLCQIFSTLVALPSTLAAYRCCLIRLRLYIISPHLRRFGFGRAQSFDAVDAFELGSASFFVIFDAFDFARA